MTKKLSEKYSVKIGYCPTRRTVFSREDSLRYKALIRDKLVSWGIDLVDLESINEEGLLVNPEDVPKAIELFRREDVDAVFAPHCNFGTEDAVAKVGKALGKPFLLWGPRDEAPLDDGLRLRDTQCGVFATSKVLRRFGVPFTYIVNSRVDEPVFERGFKNFLAAAAVVKQFRQIRIGQISTRPGPFYTVIVDEADLLERFGIEVVPTTHIDIVESVNKKLNEQGDSVKAVVEEFKKRADFRAIKDEMIARIAALKLTIEEWAEAEGLSAIAIQCWSAMQTSLGIMPCFIDSELTGAGLPVACETDIHGAVTALIAQAARLGETPIFFADLTVRHPENDNAELLWHCGPFPLALKDPESEAKVSPHYILPDEEPGVCEWRIKGGDISICRFDRDAETYKLLMGHARGTTGPHNRGTYVWVEVDNWPRWEERIVRGPHVHHVAGIHGKIAPVLYEACRYIPGMEPDPVEPTEAEIRAWLRGE